MGAASTPVDTQRTGEYRNRGRYTGTFGKSLALNAPEDVEAALRSGEVGAAFPDGKIAVIAKTMNEAFYPRHRLQAACR